MMIFKRMSLLFVCLALLVVTVCLSSCQGKKNTQTDAPADLSIEFSMTEIPLVFEDKYCITVGNYQLLCSNFCSSGGHIERSKEEYEKPFPELGYIPEGLVEIERNLDVATGPLHYSDKMEVIYQTKEHADDPEYELGDLIYRVKWLESGHQLTYSVYDQVFLIEIQEKFSGILFASELSGGTLYINDGKYEYEFGGTDSKEELVYIAWKTLVGEESYMPAAEGPK